MFDRKIFIKKKMSREIFFYQISLIFYDDWYSELPPFNVNFSKMMHYVVITIIVKFKTWMETIYNLNRHTGKQFILVPYIFILYTWIRI